MAPAKKTFGPKDTHVVFAIASNWSAAEKPAPCFFSWVAFQSPQGIWSRGRRGIASGCYGL